MWTAAKLVAGVLFAGLAWYASQLIKPEFPEGTDLGWFAEVNAAIGFVMGWIIAGTRAGGSWSAAVSYGLTTAVAMTVAGLFLHSGAEMVRRSLMRVYDGPAEAVVAVFELMVEHGLIMATAPIIGTLLIGGVMAALLVEITGRNFR
jgi:hypothetical protein